MKKLSEKHIMVAIFGTGIGFGVGFALASFTVMEPIGEGGSGIPFYFFFLLVMVGLPAIAGIVTGKWSIAGVFLIISLVSLLAGGKVFEWGSPPLSRIFLAIPFTALGGTIGYKLSRKRRPTISKAEGYEQEFGGGEQETAGREEERRQYGEEEWYQSEEKSRFERESGTDDIYYNILGVKPSATQDEIKRAYRQKINEYHPDKFMNQPEWVRKEAEAMTKKLNEAYEVLMKEDTKGSEINGN